MAGSHQIWELDYSKEVLKNYAGSGAEANQNHDSNLKKSAWAQPSGLTIGNFYGSWELYIADSESSTIRAINLENESSCWTVVGGETTPWDLFAFGDKDGSGTDAKL